MAVIVWFRPSSISCIFIYFYIFLFFVFLVLTVFFLAVLLFYESQFNELFSLSDNREVNVAMISM